VSHEKDLKWLMLCLINKNYTLEVEEGCTVRDAVRHSNIIAFFSDVNVETIKVGIFWKKRCVMQRTSVKEGERVELYRELKTVLTLNKLEPNPSSKNQQKAFSCFLILWVKTHWLN